MPPLRKRKKAPPAQLRHALVAQCLKSGEILVDLPGDPPQRVLCDFLESTANQSLTLEPGDRVLIYPPAHLKEKGCVLGKIGAYREPDQRRVEIEAGEELTLRCGEGSITIRKSGQILIKGLDIVSHARRNNRVRGGSVQLN